MRIARWEVSRGAGTVDRRTALVVVAMLLVGGVVGVSAVDDGLGLEDDLYRVGVEEASPLEPALAESDRLPLVETTPEAARRGEVDVVAFVDAAGAVHDDGTANGEAAHEAIRDAVEAYNDRLLAAEADQAAAYPVEVDLEYRSRGAGGGLDPALGGTGDEPDESADDLELAGEETTDDAAAETTDDAAAETADESATGSDDSPLGVPDVAGGTLEEAATPGTPGSLSPPFPFGSLVLAFLFVVPMNFVIQAYGSTIMDERIKRRGELLLVSPASRHAIVAGKTLPYLLGLLGIIVVVAFAIGGGPLSVAAAIPIALLFLSAAFVGAMLSRSFKELTFVTVAISVFLTTYTFVPAIFTDVTPIALISPLTLVVMDLQGDPVSAGAYLFSTATFYLGSAVCFLLGVGIYREEDLFAQKPVPSKVVDAVASRIHGYRSIPTLSILFMPFVFAAELLAVSLLFALPLSLSLPVLVLTIAAIEEFAKSVHVYAGFARSRFSASIRVAVVLGVLSGTGFFVGEKLTHVVQFVGMPDLLLGQAAFGPAVAADPLVLVALFLAPLALHVVTAVITALGASEGLRTYAFGFVVATVVHAVYNVGVMTLVA